MTRTAEIFRSIVLDMSGAENDQTLYEEKEARPAGRLAVAVGYLYRVLGMLIVTAILITALSVVVPRFAGYDSYVVASGSMEPNLPVGSIVYAQSTDPALLRAGDIIVFYDTSRRTEPITHRVVSNNPFTRTIVTKGDANEHEDSNMLAYENVVGKVERYVPYLGYAASVFSNTVGRVFAAFLLILAWAMNEVGQRLIRMRKGNDAKRQTE